MWNAEFPKPIQESIKVLQNHVYVPLADVQMAQEEELEKKRYTVCMCLLFSSGLYIQQHVFYWEINEYFTCTCVDNTC